jgi:hypothetical protein
LSSPFYPFFSSLYSSFKLRIDTLNRQGLANQR